MPTENQSSNTEMVSVQATIESLEEAYAGDSALEFMNNAAQLLRQFKSLSTLEHPGEPVGTLLIDEYFDGREVGDVDAQLDTKACEQLAEKYPGQSLPLYICPAPAVAGEVERLRSLAGQLAEQDALLRDKSGDLIRMAAHLISAPLFALQDLQDEDKKMTRARVDHAVDVADARLKDAAYELRRIADALSASAGPIQLDHEIPGTSFERLNMLANQGE